MATVMERRIRGRERQDIADELRRRVEGEVRFDPHSRLLYSTDASIYQMEPVGVVIPRSSRRRAGGGGLRGAGRRSPCCLAPAAPAWPGRR